MRQARRAAGQAGFEASQRYGWDEVNQELVDAYIRVIRQHDGGRQQREPGSLIRVPPSAES